MMEFLYQLAGLLRNLGDEERWAAFLQFVGGPWTVYWILAGVVFVETGFVVMPFLPGDSLLFALGAIGSNPKIGLNIYVAGGLLIAAALVGDNVNYWVGRKLGPKIFSKESEAAATGHKPPLSARLLNKKHLARTEKFFAKHGGKAVILARFVAFIRTFTPFVAGLGRMHYGKFLTYSVVGAVLWVVTCVGAGVLFGNIPFVRHHFELVVLGIMGATFIPVSIELYRKYRRGRGTSVPRSESSSVVVDPGH